MKRVLLAFIGTMAIALYTQAQLNNDYPENIGLFKVSGGYTHDFPGLNGYSIIGEYSHSLTDALEGAFAVKRIQLSGYPRSETINEYTKATTIEFAMYYLPVQQGDHILRIGAGYAFAFYNIRRSYPVIHTNGTEKSTTWHPQDKKGRGHGFSLIGEYEYLFPGSNLSVGIRAALYKAYDRVSYIGPFVGVRL